MRSTRVWEELQSHKTCVVEPRGGGRGEELDAAMKKYFSSIDEGGGAVMFAVLRGKVRRHTNWVSVGGL